MFSSHISAILFVSLSYSRRLSQTYKKKTNVNYMYSYFFLNIINYRKKYFNQLAFGFGRSVRNTYVVDIRIVDEKFSSMTLFSLVIRQRTRRSAVLGNVRHSGETRPVVDPERDGNESPPGG